MPKRTTLTIDDDVLAVARALAARDRKSVGAVISALARKGLLHDGPPHAAERNGVLLLPTRRSLVTPELINRLHSEQP